MRLQLLLWFLRELLLASELSNDGLFIVILLRALCPEEELLLADEFGWALSVVQQSLQGIGRL